VLGLVVLLYSNYLRPHFNELRSLQGKDFCFHIVEKNRHLQNLLHQSTYRRQISNHNCQLDFPFSFPLFSKRLSSHVLQILLY
jgi:hypothetical protein